MPADRGSAADATAGDGRASTYVGLGLQLGGQEDELMTGATLDVDRRVWQWVWLHGGASFGSVPALLGGIEDGSYWHAHAGVAARGCAYDTSAMCGFVGVDAGVRSFAPPLEMSTIDAVLVPRIGADFGGERLRFRPTVAVPVDLDGDFGVTVTAALAVGL